MKKLSEEHYKIISDYYTKYGKLRTLARRHPECFKELLYDNTDNIVARKVMMLRYCNEPPLRPKEIQTKLGISDKEFFKLHRQVMEKAIFCNTGSKR